MREFHENEQLNVINMDGKPSGMMLKRHAIKLSAGPKIIVALPIGTKRYDLVVDCPTCKERGEDNPQLRVNKGFNPEGLVPFEFMLHHMNWLSPLNVTMGYMYKTGVLSAEARQVMTTSTIETVPTADYIFYVDDDMIIPPMGLYAMYNWMERHPDWGAVSGVYTTRVNPPEPLVYTEHGRGAAWDFELGPGAKPTQIMGAGAGCLLARVEAIKSWNEANPGEPIWCDSSEFPASNGGRVTWGHDVRFVRNLTEAGWPCFVLGEVLCGHYDIATKQVFGVPADAPGFKMRQDRIDAERAEWERKAAEEA